ncbi:MULTISPECIES: HAD family hydrolase [unclassified Butyrivibrio]|uniref:HAD family hydrolase n=1 Tax=unclassified Butyrivibrio TaxID=2639466 RepID=UPI0003B6FFB5|nr:MULTISPECIES: HAD family hydrolase [unclassified Butyrivibrio]
MENKNPEVNYLKVVIVIAVIFLIAAFCIIKGGRGTVKTNTSSGNALASWTDTAPAKEALINYMSAITDENSADYIPVERRIAVFDLDGTLFSETNPIYFDHSLLLHRVLEDPDYKDKASDFEKDVAAQILQWIQDGEYPKTMDIDHGTAISTAFAGMTVDEFQDYVEEFSNQPAPGYDGMTRGESFYQPMMEVIDFLNENDFTVYVVSGTDRFIVRGGVRNNLKVPMNQIIGSDETIEASGQGDEDGLKYQFTADDKVITGGEFVVKNLKTNKVTAIVREIGVQPVLAFGNSSGDFSMANYVIHDNQYKSLAFMLCCDDVDREYGNLTKAEKMEADCAEQGFIPVSMKNDWTTIYKEGVKKNPDVGLDIYDQEYEEIMDDAA